MPASTPRSSPEAPARPSAPLRGLADDEQGVSEVVGFLLTFGILSLMLVGSMVAFNVAQEAAEVRAVHLQAESAAARVAGLIVQTSLLAEQQGSTSSLAFAVDLPEQFEGYAYDVRVEAAGGVGVSECSPDEAFPDQVCVVIPALDLRVTAPVFSAAAPVGVKICTTEVDGGEILVRYDLKTTAEALLGGACSPAVGAVTKVIFLGVN